MSHALTNGQQMTVGQMSIATRRQREKAERRVAILEAAARVFATKGFAVATMEEVAAEAELSKGTLYLYFRSKDDLFLELSAQIMGAIVEVFEKAVAGHGRGLEGLATMLHAYAAHVVRYPDHFRSVVTWLSTGYKVDTTAPSFTAHRAQVSRLIAALVAMIARGRDDGSIRAELDPMVTASQVWGGMYGTLQILINKDELNRRFPQPVDFEHYIPGYIALLIEGLRTK
jgi:AcrR family transcriptional regulator